MCIEVYGVLVAVSVVGAVFSNTTGAVIGVIVSVVVDVLVGTPELTGDMTGNTGVVVETIGVCGELAVAPAFLIS